MDQFSVYVPKLLPKDENFIAGRRSCRGCGKALAARLAAKALGGQSLVSPDLPKSVYQIAPALTDQSYTYHDVTTAEMLERLILCADECNNMTAAATPSAVKATKKAVIEIDRKIFMADPLALTRNLQINKDVLYLCFDNEPYMDILVEQTAPQPFVLAETRRPVTPDDVRQVILQKNIPPVAAEASFAYAATACPSLPFDFLEKVKKGLACTGNAFISVLTPCPTGWIFPPELTVKVGLMAVKTGYFPLYEQHKGALRITKQVKRRKPIQEYFTMQKRFFTFSAQLFAAVQSAVDERYDNLLQEQRI